MFHQAIDADKRLSGDRNPRLFDTPLGPDLAGTIAVDLDNCGMRKQGNLKAIASSAFPSNIRNGVILAARSFLFDSASHNCRANQN
jgi:hypothetical protein